MANFGPRRFIYTHSSEQADIFFRDNHASRLSCSTCILKFWNSFSRCDSADWPYIFDLTMANSLTEKDETTTSYEKWEGRKGGLL